MRIAVIQASSQVAKNELIYSVVKKYAAGAEVINFGCFGNEDNKYSYIEISVLVGLLLSSKSVTTCRVFFADISRRRWMHIFSRR